MAWHKQLFVPRATAVETACTVCGRVMWLPATKVADYRRCSKECIESHWAAGREARRRGCETCGKAFIPRQYQLDSGGGRFCSQRCNAPAREALQTKEVQEKRTKIRRQMEAEGKIKRYKGDENPRWMGGKAASVRRRTVAGKNAATVRAYREKNRDKCREWSRRRAKGKVLPRLPYGTIPRIGLLQRWRCAICRVSVKSGYHLDHINPIAKGGKHEPRNLQLLCQSCNVRKSAKDPIAYMQQIGRLL